MKNNKKIIGIVSVTIILIIFSLVGYFISKPVKLEKESEIFVDTQVETKSKENDINVYINGEIKKPGVYKLKDNSRVQQIVELAGGFTKDADTHKLNLAKKLKDEDYIYVDKKRLNNNGSNEKSKNCESEKIDINSATKEELKKIPGVGDVTAQKIIDYREEKGRFSKIEDLTKVDRIGQKTLERIKDKIEAR